MKEKGKKYNFGKSTRNAPMFVPMGISMGTAIGVSTGNLALWLCLGVCFGLCIGSGLDAGNRKKAYTENAPKDSEVSDHEET